MDNHQGGKTCEGPLKLYVGTKIIQGTEMDEVTFLKVVKGLPVPETQESRPGYKVTYPDGYISWSPKEVFENAYREITLSEFEMLGV